MVEKSDNYFVIITREGLPNLPYSTEEIYGIRMSGKYGGLKPVYNEFYRIYGGDNKANSVIAPKTIIVEDSNSGYEFYSHLPKRRYQNVISANGKSNIISVLSDLPDEGILIIVDGAAFGAEIRRVMDELETRSNTHIYLPESFEWIILKSGLIDGNAVADVLNRPWDYIESSEYVSWERFFTALLIRQTNRTYAQYRKASLNPVYYSDKFVKAILAVMRHIRLV